MKHTYTQLYIQFVFSVKYRRHLLILNDSNLHKYINGIVINMGCKMLAINNMADHIHILISKKPNISEAELMQKIKANSSRWLKKYLNCREFEWQRGYGAFSYSQSRLKSVKKYIINQQEHHKNTTYRDEMITFFQKFEIPYTEEDLEGFLPCD